MTTDELKKEAEEYLRKQTQLNGGGLFHCNILNLILGFAEPREKRIAELEKENAELKSEKQKKKDEEQLTKAKELLKRCYDNYIYLQPLRGDIEQFLNSEEK